MNRRILLTFLILCTVLSAFSLTAQAQTPTSRLRVIHVAAGVPAVDVYIDGLMAAEALEFAGTTPHFLVEAGSHVVALRPAGSLPGDPPVAQTSVDVIADLAFSVIIQGTAEAPEFFPHEDILDPIDAGLSRLGVVLAVPGSEAIDIVRADTGPLMLGVNYGVSSGTINIPSGFYDLVAVPSGGSIADAVATIGQLDFISNTLVTLLIVPTEGGAEALILMDAVNPAAGAALTRFFHAAPDAGDVDLYLDGVLVLTNLNAGEATPHIGLSTGEHELALREAGALPNAEAFFTETITLSEDAQTIALMPADDTVAVEIVEDAATGITPEMARVQVVNLTGADAEVTLNDTSITDPLDTAPGDVAFGGAIELEEALYGGTLYTIFVYGDGDTAFAATPLSVNLLSVPFEQVAPIAVATEEPAVVEATAEPAATEEVAVAETPASSEVVNAETPSGELVPLNETPSGEVVAVPTASTVVETPASSEVVPGEVVPSGETTPPVVETTPVAPVTNPSTDTTSPFETQVVRGTVNLNDGVNLQCREYPSTDARSLGLIPNNTELIIQGVAGPRDDLVGRPDAMVIATLVDLGELPTEEFTVDNFEATFLELLTLGDFWLDVSWIVDTGGAFGCWTNALYVLASFEGNLINEPRAYLDLIDQGVLAITPYNVPAGPREVGPDGISAVPPTPMPREDRIIATVSVDPSSNLQLRRTPSVNGESLALVPGGSQLIVFEKTVVEAQEGVNVPTVPEWLFVEFTDASGSAWRGWVSAQYVTLTHRGQLIQLTDVPEAVTVQTGGPVTPGAPAGGSTTGTAPALPTTPAQSQPAAPTGPVVEGHLLTDPGMELNMRDRPSTDGIVRIGVPNDAVLTVVGRNGEGTWYEVIYNRPTNNVRGWVAAQFIELMFQGQPYDPANLPVTTAGETDTIGPTPTPTPGS